MGFHVFDLCIFPVNYLMTVEIQNEYERQHQIEMENAHVFREIKPNCQWQLIMFQNKWWNDKMYFEFGNSNIKLVQSIF